MSVVGTALAVHDQDFQLDGDTSPTDLDPGPGSPTIDWEDLFDVTDGVASPKGSLPAGFISAFFARDFVPGESGPDRTTFATGSKDTLNITPGWQCARDNNVNDKTDLVNVFATAYVDPGSGELKLYFALERYSNDGAGNVAFWFMQDGSVSCEAPASGPSTTDFTGNHRDGDVLVVSEFTVGGTISTINAYHWVGGAGGFLDPTPIASGADCKDDETGGDTICATVNTTAFTSPWLTETKQSGPGYSNELDVSEFFEGGISLTNLGLADRCFNRMLADTRSSPSLTATIFDYAIGDLPVCNLKVTKDGDTLSKVGDDVDYTITIENTGGITLYKQSIVDSLFGDLTDGTNALITFSDCGASLAAGDSCTINVTRTVQEGDDDPLPNTVTVVYDSRSDLLGDEVTREDSHSVNLFQPAIAVDKTGDTLSKVGDDVNYTFTLSNNSSADTPDLECTAVDTLFGTIFDDVLSPGDTVINKSRTVLDTDSDPLDNTVTLTCSPVGFPNVLEESDSHSVNLFQPAIAIAKTGDELSKVGDDVNYTITLSNNSSDDTPALSCVATDSLLGEVFNGVLPLGDTVLDPSYTVQEGDPDPLDNSVSMTCTVAGFPNVLDAGPATHSTNLFQPAVEVIKTGPDTASRGETITYDYTINNLSSDDSPDLILESVTDTVLGDLTAAAAAGGCSTLGFGGTCNFTADYTIQFDDPNPLVNVVTVLYHPEGFPNDITDDDDHMVQIPILGCTPGFWQGGAGAPLWDVPMDQDWFDGGYATPYNPYDHNTLFNDFFNDALDINGNGLVDIDTRLDGYTMYQLVSSGGGSDPAVKAARDMVAAYLNESAFPTDYPADSLEALLIQWYDAVAGGDAGLAAFHNLVSGWNAPEPPGYCPLP